MTSDAHMAAFEKALAQLGGSGSGDSYQHVDGLWWHEAPLPPRRHRCSPWTTGRIGLDQIERCACGAIRRAGYPWDERNSRHPTTAWYDRWYVRAVAFLLVFVLAFTSIIGGAAWVLHVTGVSMSESATLVLSGLVGIVAGLTTLVGCYFVNDWTRA